VLCKQLGDQAVLCLVLADRTRKVRRSEGRRTQDQCVGSSRRGRRFNKSEFRDCSISQRKSQDGEKGDEHDSRYAGRFRSVLGEVNDVVSKNADSIITKKVQQTNPIACAREFYRVEYI